MCLLCLADFDFVIPESTPALEKKQKRAKRIKVMLNAADVLMKINYEVCQTKITELKEEQYKLSREF